MDTERLKIVLPDGRLNREKEGKMKDFDYDKFVSSVENMTEVEKMSLSDLLIKNGYPFTMSDYEKKEYSVFLGDVKLPVSNDTVVWFYNKLDYIPKSLATTVNDKISIKRERIINCAKAKIDVTDSLHDFDGYLTALVDAGVMHHNRRRKTLDVLYAELENIRKRFT